MGPLMVQVVVGELLNVTGLSEPPPVAATVYVGPPTDGEAGGVEVKVMSCVAFCRLTLNSPLVAEANVPSPALVTVRLQVPDALVTDTVVPVTEQPLDVAALNVSPPVPLPPDAAAVPGV